jgi:fibrillarin-like rRNA methylase
LYDTAYTNLAGVADFNFNDVYQLGQAGVAVLDINASLNNKSGKGIVKIEQETTSTETVFIQ